MNKISKKIVSLVTMAAFALTLVPAAAFATEVSDVHATVTPTSSTDVLLTGDSVSIDFNVKIGDDFNATYPNGQIAFWYGKADDAMPGVDFSSTQDGYTDADLYESDADWKDTNWFPAGLTDGGNSSITATFDAAGVYDLYVGSWTSGETLATMDVQKFATVTVRTTDADAGNSRLLIDGDDEAVSVAQNTAQEFEFNVRTADNHESTLPLANADEDVYVWAENSAGEIVTDVTFAAVDSANTVEKVGTKGLWKVTGPVMDKTALTATFATSGDGYTLNATTIATGTVPNITDKKVPASDNDLTPVKVNVTKEAVKTAEISFLDTDKNDDIDVAGADGEYTYTINDDVTPSGVKVYTVTGKAVTKDDVAAQGEVLKVTAKRGVTLDGLSDEGTVTTDARGEFEFTFTVNDNGEFDIVVEEVNGDASSTLTVVTDKIYVGNIKTVEDGGYLLAGNETKYSTANVGTSRYFADAVQFELTDVNGNEVTGQPFDEKTYTLSITKPDGSKLVAKDLSLVWDKANGVYTLKYTDNDKTDITKDLIPGKYTVKVAFKSSDKAATASFNLAKFGTVQDIVLDMYAGPADWYNSSSNDAIKVIDDQVALGQSVEVVPSYVDENGIKVRANYADLDAGVNGEAVVDNGYHWYNGLLYFDTFANTPANNSLVGTTITVKVFDEENGKYVEKELTVVKNYLAETLSFDPTNGVVGEDNKVAVSVVDEEGNLSKVNGELHAYVEDQSNDDAYVELKVKNDNVKNGKGELTLYSDKEGTADVRVVVTANNGEMYGATLTYTFGAEDPNAENTVVMTIGSTDYVVNNDIIKGDAAPYVDAQWRTMVPFRVLGETFGAEVNWDQDTQTVTYTYGDTELTMTIGEETYTVNGTEKTMDTAPVLSGDRTFVPVRFVGEALGYTVTALQDGETGLTASVVFQK